MKPSPPRNTPHAFTLVELLAVIGLIILLAGLSGIAINSVGQSQNLDTTAEELRGELIAAAFAARASNRKTEVRIYTELDPPRYATVEAGDTPRFITNVRKLPETVRFASEPAYSRLLSGDNPVRSEGTGDSVPPDLREENYHAVEFLPDGRTGLALDSDSWTITLRGRNAQPSGDAPAPNFATLVIDPVTAGVTIHRP